MRWVVSVPAAAGSTTRWLAFSHQPKPWFDRTNCEIVWTWPTGTKPVSAFISFLIVGSVHAAATAANGSGAGLAVSLRGGYAFWKIALASATSAATSTQSLSFWTSAMPSRPLVGD